MKKYIRIDETELNSAKRLLQEGEISYEEVLFPSGVPSDEIVVDSMTEEDYYQSSDWEDSGC